MPGRPRSGRDPQDRGEGREVHEGHQGRPCRVSIPGVMRLAPAGRLGQALNRCDKRQQTGPSLARSTMDSRQVDRLVCVNDEVSEPRRPDQPVGQLRFEKAGMLQAAKRVCVPLRRSDVTHGTRSHREIDHNLRRLPEAKNHRIGRVGRCGQVFRPGRKRLFRLIEQHPRRGLRPHPAGHYRLPAFWSLCYPFRSISTVGHGLNGPSCAWGLER